MNVSPSITSSQNSYIPSESKYKKGPIDLLLEHSAEADLYRPLERPMTPSRLNYTLHQSPQGRDKKSFENFISSLQNHALIEQIQTSVRLYHCVARHSPLLHVFNYLTSSLFLEMNDHNPTSLYKGTQEVRNKTQLGLDHTFLSAKCALFHLNIYYSLHEQVVDEGGKVDETISKKSLDDAAHNATEMSRATNLLKRKAELIPLDKKKEFNKKVNSLKNTLQKINDFAKGLIKLTQEPSQHHLILSSTRNVISNKKITPTMIEEAFNHCQKVIAFELETTRISIFFDVLNNYKFFGKIEDDQHPGPVCKELLKQIRSLNIHQPVRAKDSLIAILKPFYQREEPFYVNFLSVLGTNAIFSLLKKVIEQKSADITLKKGGHHLLHFMKLRMLLKFLSPIWRETVQKPQHIITLLEEPAPSEQFQELLHDANTLFLSPLENKMESLREKFDMGLIEEMDSLIGKLLCTPIETYRYVEILTQFKSLFIHNLLTEIAFITFTFYNGFKQINNKYKDPIYKSYLKRLEGVEQFFFIYFSATSTTALDIFAAAINNTPIEPRKIEVDSSSDATSEESTDIEEELPLPETKEEIEEIPPVEEPPEIKVSLLKEELEEKESTPNVAELLRGNLESHKFLKLLKDLGCKPIRHGKHPIYQSEEGKTFPVPYHPKQGMNKNLALSILKNVLEEK